jgi:AraC-like DNA-binding protein
VSSPTAFGSVVVYQIGRLHCNGDTVIVPHPQFNCFELTVVTDGEGSVFTDGVETRVHGGDIYVSFAGDFHSIVSDPNDPLKYDFISVSTARADLSEDLERIVERYHSPETRVIRDERIGRLLSRAISEINNEQYHSEIIIEAIVNQMLVYTIRDFKSLEHRLNIDGVPQSDLICFKAMNYIDNHIYTMKSLAELCEVTNYSYNYLSNLFKKTTSDTLLNYYRNRRLETANLLLRSEEYSVTEVANMLNYSSIYSFSLAFKKKYGFSPSYLKERKG